MKKLSILFAAVIAVALLSISWKAANEGATNTIVPIGGDIWSPCTGETIFLEGDLHILSNVTINDNNLSVMAQQQMQGVSGVGLTSGTKYNLISNSKTSVHGSLINGSYNVTYTVNFKLISQGAGGDLMGHYLVHITVNANGDITSTVDNISVDCK